MMNVHLLNKNYIFKKLKSLELEMCKNYFTNKPVLYVQKGKIDIIYAKLLFFLAFIDPFAL